MFVTEDAGATWETLSLAYDRLGAKKFVDHPEAISHIVETVEPDGYALLTLDPVSGEWREQALPSYVRNVQFVTRDFGLAVNNDGLWLTENGGETWTIREQEVITTQTQLYPADEENRLAINRVVKIETGGGEAWEVLLHYEVSETNDGGATWETRKVTKDCDYTNSSNGLVTRTPDNGFLTVASRANLVRLGG
jgi:photosystem II stability/assembly factor-like uncharacterized protein